jgi:hypothetical protein
MAMLGITRLDELNPRWLVRLSGGASEASQSS